MMAGQMVNLPTLEPITMLNIRIKLMIQQLLIVKKRVLMANTLFVLKMDISCVHHLT